MKEAIKSIRKEDWQSYKGDREVAETIHIMNNTKEVFRFIVQRWLKLQGELFDTNPYSYNVIATNKKEPAEDIVHQHNQRGQAENFIKELGWLWYKLDALW